MNLKRKILLAELPLLVILATVSISSVLMIRLGGMTDVILKDNYRSLLAAQRMEAALDATDRLVTTRGPEAATVTSIAAAVGDFERELVIQENNITEPGEAEATRDLRSSFVAWRAAATRAGAIGDTAARREAHRGAVLPAEDAVRADIDSILTLNQDAMMRKSSETKSEAEDLSRTLALVSILALVLASVVALFLADKLTKPLGSLAESARRIGEGDLDVPLAEVAGDDEVARLVREFRGMAERLRAYRRSSLGELLEATEAAQAAIDSLADPVITFHADASFKRANEAAHSLVGIDHDLEDPLAPLVPELRTAVARVRDHVLKGKGPQVPRGLENAIPILVNGRPRYLQPIATPIYADASGAVVGVAVLLRDVTSLRRADELKTDLLSTVAHELRTPLTSIRMSLYLCLEEKVGPLTEKQQELLLSARDDAERLHRIVEGILSVSKIEAGVLVGRRRAVAPRKLVDTAVAPFRVRAADQRIALETRACEVPLVEVDEDSIILVLTNILDNAFKETPENGRIEVTAEPVDDGVRFGIRDTGGGIPAEYQPRLFEKFYRVPGAPPGGTGLGLSIARDIVYAHDGEIGVESEVGKGSRFWFRLPASRSLSASSEGPALAAS